MSTRALFSMSLPFGLLLLAACGGASDDPHGTRLVEGGGQDLKVFILSKLGKISVWEESRAEKGVFQVRREREREWKN